MKDISSLVEFSSHTLRDHSKDGLRSGEGSIVALKDGGLLLAYSEFSDGASDESNACIAAMNSSDDGRTWTTPRTMFTAQPPALNVMSASLLRMHDGNIGCIFCHKYSQEQLIPFWSVSRDEGATWSAPRPITSDEGYFVVVSDRLIQHSNGQLILPYALHIGIGEKTASPYWDPAWNARCGVFYSSDMGESWSRSEHWVTHTPAAFRPPLCVDPSAAEKPTLQHELANRLGAVQEPGVQELADGSLMLYMRSAYSIYRCFTRGVECPWEDFGPMPGVVACMSPQTIRRLPGSDDLVMFYNDRSTVPFGNREFVNRTPLSVAISKDSGRSWKKLGYLEGPERNYCYFSLLFHKHRFLTTYYGSTTRRNEHGAEFRQSLSSLIVGSGDHRKLSLL